VSLRFSERRLYAECEQARPALERLERLRDRLLTMEVALEAIAEGYGDPAALARVALDFEPADESRSVRG
jgi:ribosomal 50S subunit-associated protein YjgA (DUF615 family)